MIDRILNNMDEDMANRVLKEMDEQTLSRALTTGIESHIIPHMEDVKTAATEEYEDSEDVRAFFESMDSGEQTDTFHEVAADMIAVLTKLREDPVDGGLELKERLRDPWTVEALLLVFDHEGVPEEVAAEQKDFAAQYLKYIGVNVVPEVYDEDEVREVVEEMYPADQVESVVAELNENG